MDTLYADIVLPLALPPFTFEVGAELVPTIAEGYGVEVPLGGRKVYTGIVWRLHRTRPPFRTIKSVVRAVRPERIVGREQMVLWEWIADYYMCSLGEVMRAAMPALLTPSGFAQSDIDSKLYSPRKELRVALSDRLGNEEALGTALEELRKRKKGQYEALVKLCGLFEPAAAVFGGDVARAELDCSSNVLRKLVEADCVKCFEREVSISRGAASPPPRLATLSEEQVKALKSIKSGFEEHDTVVLHGITGSGKTEIYMHLAAEAVADGRSVLYLLPEIAITRQLVERLRKVFGDSLTVYNSSMTARARAETYLRLCRSEGGEIVVGSRSAVLLPLANLGLVIVDEEHDASFKQSDPAPRYSARDTAVWIARNLGAKTLLGSATPSLESYRNCLTGKYGLVTLSERYGSGRLPKVKISDTLRSARRGERRGHINKELSDAMRAALAAGRQVMLFQNRRGFAPYVECTECGWIPRCPHCNVSLTYYKSDRSLRCNLCGHTEPMPRLCPVCGKEPSPCGFGTEKIEENITALFPDARVGRLDGDVASSASAAKRVIADFEQHRTDILIGTQMITKGFDFDGVALVGVLNADNLLNRPDFRADERTFQTVTQISGRAGRTDAEGLTIVQTASPDNPTIIQIEHGDYYAMVQKQLEERRMFDYPPFTRIVILRLENANQSLLQHSSARIAALLRTRLGDSAVTDAHSPAVDKTADVWLSEIMIRITADRHPSEVKQSIGEVLAECSRDKILRRTRIIVDVDPQ